MVNLSSDVSITWVCRYKECMCKRVPVPKKKQNLSSEMLVVQLNMQDLHSGLCKGDVSWCLVGFGKTLQLFCLGNCFQANVEA